ncbi:hypothetical protein NDU88_005964 [Pleurodeles waltl]|uniref:Uncharacterized protein n=1 Tax=Pleurodeles waltl TaxID=8319 RepID=A0AAV7NTS0_PLEWA|nr:hypothetical protein NDU88_005964 [Pleurodeles waltl]
MGAEPDARSPDFRVPNDVKRNDGHQRRGEESSDAMDARRGSKEPEDAVPARQEDETGKPELPRARTGSEKSSSQQETSAHRHVPGGTWLRKVP